MSGNFFSYTSEDLQKIYVDDYNMIDQFALTGSLWTWGQNNYGQLGNNAQGDRSSPVQTISGGTNWKLVSCGIYHTAAIKTDGTLWLWGYNAYGQLGTNNRTDRSSPVQTVSGGTNWQQVNCGVRHTAAIKTDGSLWLWGSNYNGRLGNNAQGDRSSPVQTISGGTNWQQVSCGFHTAAIKTDGTLWLWGYNYYGQLGNNSQTDRSSPVQTVAGGTDWQQVSCGSYHTAAIKTDGSLWLWGYNYNGQLGNNDLNNRSSPVQTVSGGTNWKQLGVRGNNSAAIKTDGSLWLWGTNYAGQLGDNTSINRSSPVQTVSSGTNWKQVSAGVTSGAVKTDGTLWTWGQNDDLVAAGGQGTLGDATQVFTRSSPVQTVSGGNNWKQISGIYHHMAAIYFYDAGNLYPSS